METSLTDQLYYLNTNECYPFETTRVMCRYSASLGLLHCSINYSPETCQDNQIVTLHIKCRMEQDCDRFFMKISPRIIMKKILMLGVC